MNFKYIFIISTLNTLDKRSTQDKSRKPEEIVIYKCRCIDESFYE